MTILRRVCSFAGHPITSTWEPIGRPHLAVSTCPCVAKILSVRVTSKDKRHRRATR